MSDSALGWCEEVHGVEWRTGSGGVRFGHTPFPVSIAVALLRQSSPAAMAAGLAGDVVLHATRLLLTFRAAEQVTEHDAPRVAAALSNLAALPDVSDYRVVAHSLGCRLVIDALPLLPPQSRPIEVHLCAAAVTASRALPRLDDLCKPGGHLYHHWASSDEALLSGFLIASHGEPALGSGPLPPTASAALSHSSITKSSHDASAYLGIASHGAYRSLFHRLASDASLGRPPPPKLPFVEQQRAKAAAYLTRALRRLPTATQWALPARMRRR